MMVQKVALEEILIDHIKGILETKVKQCVPIQEVDLESIIDQNLPQEHQIAM